MAALKKLNWNTDVKVKLTDLGKDIYFHRHDDLNNELVKRGFKPFATYFPKVDENGYSAFTLWDFMQLYGSHIGMGFPDIVQDISFYISEEDLDEVEVINESL